MKETAHTPLRVMLFGWTNLNVIDGSSFFITSLADSLALSPLIVTDILLATPLRRTLVLDEVIGKPNVRVLDPFRDSRLGLLEGPDDTVASITHQEAAECISFYASRDEHDAILIRSTEVAAELIRSSPGLADRVVVYVTGLSHVDTPLEREFADYIRFLATSGVHFAVQTPEMQDRFLLEFEDFVPSARTHVLSPMVAGEPGAFEDVFSRRDRYSRLTYTGKFVDLWYPDKILSGFKQARFMRPELTLDVAGDQFKHSPSDPLFPANTKYLLENSAGVSWHGGLARRDARELIRKSDIGISWRSPALDSSLELSTKLLEYGVHGKPCVLNRTEMHERLLGVDYPLFANSMREFVELLVSIVDDPSIVEKAARASYEVAATYTIKRSHAKVVAMLSQLPHVLATAKVDLSTEGQNLHTSYLVIDPAEVRPILDLLATRTIVRVDGKGPFLTFGTTPSLLPPSETFSRNLQSSAGTYVARIMSNDAQPTPSANANEDVARYADAEHQKLISSLQFEVRTLKERSTDLTKENSRALAAANQRITELTTRLDALRASKLGRIQRWIWRRRR